VSFTVAQTQPRAHWIGNNPRQVTRELILWFVTICKVEVATCFLFNLQTQHTPECTTNTHELHCFIWML